MASTEDPKDERQASSRVRVVNDELLDTNNIASFAAAFEPPPPLTSATTLQF
jgi:hypothetical protein